MCKKTKIRDAVMRRKPTVDKNCSVQKMAENRDNAYLAKVNVESSNLFARSNISAIL